VRREAAEPHVKRKLKGVIFRMSAKKTLIATIATVTVLVAVLSTTYYIPGETATVPASSEAGLEQALTSPDYLAAAQQREEAATAGTEPETGEDAGVFEGAQDDLNQDAAEGTAHDDEEEEEEPPSAIVTITISAAGDVTLGGDPRGSNQFMREFERNEQDHSHFLRNVKHIFDADDLTIVNLEGTLTEATAHMNKTYVFRGPPHFAKILSSSGVDAVTLANNHSIDFLELGYQDTADALEAEGIAYFGNDFNTILEIKGIRVGLFGFRFWENNQWNRNQITSAIKDLQERGAQLIIAYFHWGIESASTPSAYQRTLGRFTIDSGADLVLGAQPHVLQAIEEYNGKNIVYSLANFCFGGNNNPTDQDTFIFQQTFTFDDGELQDTNETNIIPVLISSERWRNNFQPIVAEGDVAQRILQRLQTYSDRFAAG